MESRRPIRVELVGGGGRQEALKGLLGLAFLGIAIGLEWWAITPEAERRVKLAKLGLTRCPAGRWHARGIPLRWPPAHCECFWTAPADRASQAQADAAERGYTK